MGLGTWLVSFLRLTGGSQGRMSREGGYVLIPAATGYPVPVYVAVAAASNKAGQK